MGPVRHQRLITVLAIFVACDIAAGVVAVSARSGTASSADAAGRTSHAGDRAGESGAAGETSGGILAGGQFIHRRRSAGGATPDTTAATAPTPASPTTDAADPATTASGPAAARATTPSTARAGATTTSTSRPVTSSTAPPATAANAGAGTTATTAPRTGGAPGGAAQPGANGANGADGSSAAGAPGASTGSTAAFTDRTGDTTAQGTGKKLAQPRADLVQSHASYTDKAIIFAVRTDQWVDPRQDPNWASDSTYVGWEIDTNGDGTPDYDVQYFLSEGTPVAGVSRVGDTEGDSLCAAEAGFTADGYAVAFDPACVGKPASFSYRVTMYYDTNPKNEDADVATDVAPDGGLSRPIARPQ